MDDDDGGGGVDRQHLELAQGWAQKDANEIIEACVQAQALDHHMLNTNAVVVEPRDTFVYVWLLVRRRSIQGGYLKHR